MRSPLRIVLTVLLLTLGTRAVLADSIADAVALARAVYYEGIPQEEVDALDDPAIARLIGMLADASEAPHHGNVVLALGMSGHPDAFEALHRYAQTPLSGEVDRATFRGRMRAFQAMGYLGREDPRALAWLLRNARGGPGEPAWSFRHHRGGALRILLEEQTLQGLALTGAAEAKPVIARARDRATGSDVAAERRRRLTEQAARVHERIERGDDLSGLRNGEPR